MFSNNQNNVTHIFGGNRSGSRAIGPLANSFGYRPGNNHPKTKDGLPVVSITAVQQFKELSLDEIRINDFKYSKKGMTDAEKGPIEQLIANNMRARDEHIATYWLNPAGGLSGNKDYKPNREIFGGQQQQGGGGLFGGQPANPPQTGGGLFGGQQQQGGGGLFGGQQNSPPKTGGGGGLFGGNTGGGGLFGGRPANPPQTGGGLLDIQQKQQQQQGGGSLFESQAKATGAQQQVGGGLSGGQANNSNMGGGSLFKNNANLQSDTGENNIWKNSTNLPPNAAGGSLFKNNNQIKSKLGQYTTGSKSPGKPCSVSSFASKGFSESGLTLPWTDAPSNKTGFFTKPNSSLPEKPQAKALSPIFSQNQSETASKQTSSLVQSSQAKASQTAQTQLFAGPPKPAFAQSATTTSATGQVQSKTGNCGLFGSKETAKKSNEQPMSENDMTLFGKSLTEYLMTHNVGIPKDLVEKTDFVPNILELFSAYNIMFPEKFGSKTAGEHEEQKRK